MIHHRNKQWDIMALHCNAIMYNSASKIHRHIMPACSYHIVPWSCYSYYVCVICAHPTHTTSIYMSIHNKAKRGSSGCLPGHGDQVGGRCNQGPLGPLSHGGHASALLDVDPCPSHVCQQRQHRGASGMPHGSSCWISCTCCHRPGT